MKRVVVIGGGFAGTKVAKILESKCNVTLIDAEDFFEYTPGILRVLVEPEHYKKLHSKHKNYLTKSKIVVGHVKKIDNKNVTLKDGKKINYDYLVIASGSSYNTPIKEQNIFFATRVKNILKSYQKIQKSQKIIIVGGGIVGVELATEIATHYKDKEILLIHSGSKIMERNNPKTSRYAEKFLVRNGVKIILNEKITNSDKKKLIGESGKEYNCDEVFFTIGIKPNVGFMNGEFSQFAPKGIMVNEYLQIPGKENIFVAGDVSNIVEEKTAQNAEKHGELVAQNILASINSEKMNKYSTKKRIMVISLGKNSGIIEYKNFVLGGWIPALLKRLIEWKVMNRFR